jgi:hypothetical protein
VKKTKYKCRDIMESFKKDAKWGMNNKFWKVCSLGIQQMWINKSTSAGKLAFKLCLPDSKLSSIRSLIPRITDSFLKQNDPLIIVIFQTSRGTQINLVRKKSSEKSRDIITYVNCTGARKSEILWIRLIAGDILSFLINRKLYTWSVPQFDYLSCS